MNIAAQLRAAIKRLRRRPIPLNELIPLMQKCADALDDAEQERKAAFKAGIDWAQMTEDDKRLMTDMNLLMTELGRIR